MESGANAGMGLLGFFMFVQLVALLALLLGGLYVLYCLGRAASGLDRLATAVESWVVRQSPSGPLMPGGGGPAAAPVNIQAAMTAPSPPPREMPIAGGPVCTAPVMPPAAQPPTGVQPPAGVQPQPFVPPTAPPPESRPGGGAERNGQL